MPQNPDKKRCAIPGCRNWAMRDHDRCRVHRDAELGPLGAGAPLGNLNALKNGTHTQPLPAPEFETLLAVAIEHPQDLPYQVGLALRSIQDRTADTFLALVAVQAMLSQLTDRVAAHLSGIELQNMLQSLPVPARSRFQLIFNLQTAGFDPVARLLFLKKIKKQRKQLPERESSWSRS